MLLNGAPSEVRTLVAARREPLVLIHSPVALGVAGGFNLARTRAKGRLLLLLHDDSRIEPGAIEALAAAAAERPDGGLFASLILNPNRTLQSAGSLLWREGFTTVRWPRAAQPPVEQFRQREPIDYAGTCGLLVRTELFDAIGGLDEELFPGIYVGVDLCQATRHAGRSVLLEPRAQIVHEGGSHLGAIELQYVVERNRARFAAKWRNELERRPDTDLTPAGYEAANRRVWLAGARLRAEFERTPTSLVSRFRLDAVEQRRRLRRLGAEVGIGFRVWCEARAGAA